MGKIVSIASQKGGVGKTTTSLNLGFALSRISGRVLILDADPQGGIGIASNLKKKTTLGIIDLLKQAASIEDVVAVTRDKSMSVLGVGAIEPADALLLEEKARSGALGSMIKQLSADYDYVIVDAPAGIGGLVQGLLAASDSVVLVVNSRNITVRSLPAFLKLIKGLQVGANPNLGLGGVLVAMHNPQSESERGLLEQIKKTFPPQVFFNTVIEFNEIYEIASLKAAPVAMIDGGRNPARAYLELAMELQDRLAATETGEQADERDIGLF